MPEEEKEEPQPAPAMRTIAEVLGHIKVQMGVQDLYNFDKL